MTKNIEVELKFQLLNKSEVAAFLTDRADFRYTSFQHDIYYNAPDRDFLADQGNISEWLRIRVEKDKAQINYKDWHPRDNPIKTHCTEYETEVGSFEQLSLILDALGFKKLIEVKKTRKAWLYKDAEVSIDEVDELGWYLEAEYKGDELQDVAEIRAHLQSIVDDIGAKTRGPDIKGYPFGLLKKKGLVVS